MRKFEVLDPITGDGCSKGSGSGRDWQLSCTDQENVDCRGHRG
jgi:hypothetical protein